MSSSPNIDFAARMIARTAPRCQIPSWQRALAEAVTDPAELLQMLHLDRGLLPAAERATALFGLRVPRSYLRRVSKGDPNDPLLRQVLPLGAELVTAPGFGPDPVGDAHATARPGLLHKYRGRALLITTGACAVHCRYCFRRQFPYGESRPGSEQWRRIRDYLESDPEIDEVILSGGDPLVLNDRRLAEWVRRLGDLVQLKRLRIHTRVPVVLPERIDAGLLATLANSRLRQVMVLHANHPREVDAQVAAALASLREARIELLNQSVLLAGVNDRVETLAELSERLFDCGVLPYYLHLLDRVQGTAHFEVDEINARALHRALRERLPGYLVPRLVREQAGAASKTPLI
jgi:EF-P beta-lysylation protein EpmB